MRKLSDIKQNPTYSKSEIESISRRITKKEDYLLESGKAISIDEFLQQNPELENRLQRTSILGYPANAVFTSYHICAGLCNQVSRLFTMCCGLEDAHTVTAMDKVLASDDYDRYVEDWRTVHHTWVEFMHNGEMKVADFTLQAVFSQKDYYDMNEISPEETYPRCIDQVALEEFISKSFFDINRRLAQLTYNNSKLIQSYDYMISYHNSHADECPVDTTYSMQQFSKTRELLASQGLTSDYQSDSNCLLMMQKRKREKDLSKVAIDTLIDESRQDIYTRLPFMYKGEQTERDKAILQTTFDKTQDMYDLVSYTYQGPKIRLGETCEDLLQE